MHAGVLAKSGLSMSVFLRSRSLTTALMRVCTFALQTFRSERAFAHVPTNDFGSVALAAPCRSAAVTAHSRLSSANAPTFGRERKLAQRPSTQSALGPCGPAVERIKVGVQSTGGWDKQTQPKSGRNGALGKAQRQLRDAIARVRATLPGFSLDSQRVCRRLARHRSCSPVSSSP
jgi:hypothetical protein